MTRSLPLPHSGRIIVLAALLVTSLCGTAQASVTELNAWRATLGQPAVQETNDPEITEMVGKITDSGEEIKDSSEEQPGWVDDGRSPCFCSIEWPGFTGRASIARILMRERAGSRYESIGIEADRTFARVIDGDLVLRVYAADPDMVSAQADKVNQITVYTFRYTPKPVHGGYAAAENGVDPGQPRGIPIASSMLDNYYPYGRDDVSVTLQPERYGRWTQAGDSRIGESGSYYDVGTSHQFVIVAPGDGLPTYEDEERDLLIKYDSRYRINGEEADNRLQPTYFTTGKMPQRIIERGLSFGSKVKAKDRARIKSSIARMKPGFRGLIAKLDGQIFIPSFSNKKTYWENDRGETTESGERRFTLSLGIKKGTSRTSYSNFLAMALMSAIDESGFEGYPVFQKEAKKSKKYRSCFKGWDSTPNSRSCVSIRDYLYQHVARYATGRWGKDMLPYTPFLVSANKTGKILSDYWFPAP